MGLLDVVLWVRSVSQENCYVDWIRDFRAWSKDRREFLVFLNLNYAKKSTFN